MPHIWLDDKHRAWIGETNVKVAEVVLDHLAYGWSAEEMHYQYPHLSLAQIYAALAYYYDHQAEFDKQIEESRHRAKTLAEETKDSPHSPSFARGGKTLRVALYMNVHVPAAIKRARRVNVLTAQADGTTRLDDPLLLDRARELGRAIFTRDEDFLTEATARQKRGEAFSGVIYAHQLRVTIRFIQSHGNAQSQWL